MLKAFAVPISWWELTRRTVRDSIEDDFLGLAAQLAYYCFLALFPAILFLLALASFFPLHNLTDDLGRAIGPFVSREVLELIRDQMRRLANAESGGLLTFGVLMALWSSSAALTAIVRAVNLAYDLEETRPWWKVRLIAIALTLAVSVLVLCAFSVVLTGPVLAGYLDDVLGGGGIVERIWLVAQWPLALGLFAMAIGLVYYFAPDADQDWVWITPGAVLATLLWLAASLGFKMYVAGFTDYEGAYGLIGGVIVLMLWLYLTGAAVLIGAEFNAEIDHASPYGKEPGEKTARGRRIIGRRAARRYGERQRRLREEGPPRPADDTPGIASIGPRPTFGMAFASLALMARAWQRRSGGPARGLEPLPAGRRSVSS